MTYIVDPITKLTKLTLVYCHRIRITRQIKRQYMFRLDTNYTLSVTQDS